MTDTDRTDLRTKMLADAIAHRDAIAAAWEAARDQRDSLRAEERRITAELHARIADVSAQIRTHSADLADACALVRSLTPRKPRTTKPDVDHHAALLDTYAEDADQ